MFAVKWHARQSKPKRERPEGVSEVMGHETSTPILGDYQLSWINLGQMGVRSLLHRSLTWAAHTAVLSLLFGTQSSCPSAALNVRHGGEKGEQVAGAAEQANVRLEFSLATGAAWSRPDTLPAGTSTRCCCLPTTSATISRSSFGSSYAASSSGEPPPPRTIAVATSQSPQHPSAGAGARTP